jgi:hypothetical protein
MHQFDSRNGKKAETRAEPLDPVALTLAIWLGLVVGVTGLMRLSENAAANAARAQQDPQLRSAALTVARPGPMLLSPYGS